MKSPGSNRSFGALVPSAPDGTNRTARCLACMNMLRRNADQPRSAVSWIALGAVLFGVWLVPACAFICAKMTPEASGVGVDPCHADRGAGHDALPKSDDCQTHLCPHLQTGVQPNLQPELPSPSFAVFHVLHGAEQVSPQVAGRHRPALSAMALGPPVPLPLFAVLRS